MDIILCVLSVDSIFAISVASLAKDEVYLRGLVKK